MKNISAFIIVMIIFLFSGCSSEENKDVIETKEYESYINNDGIFKVTLYIETGEHTKNKPIDVYSTLEYVGNEENITVWHGEPYFNYTIYDDKGVCYSEGITLTILTSTILEKGKIYTIPFQKSGGWDENTPDAEFWAEYYGDKDLKLPSERYYLTAFCNFTLSQNDHSYSNKVEAEFEVK